jgi:hypothetical protein
MTGSLHIIHTHGGAMSSDIQNNPLAIRRSFHLGMDLHLEIEGTDIRFKSALIGADPDHFLLIRVPLSEEMADLLPKKPLLVRYTFKGTVFEFKSICHQIVYSPNPAAFISCPSEYEVHELRNHERYECFLPVRIQIREVIRDGAILDVSQEGIRVAFRERGLEPSSLQKDDLVSVFIHFPKSRTEEEFTTRLRRIFHEGGRTVLGLAFSNLDSVRRCLVGNFVSDLKDYTRD